MQKPWSRPMAAQHLAAITIQSLVRRFLFKKKMEIIRAARREGRKAPWFILHPNYSENKILRKEGNLTNVG